MPLERSLRDHDRHMNRFTSNFATSALLLGTQRSLKDEPSGRTVTRPPLCPPLAAVVAAMDLKIAGTSRSSRSRSEMTSMPKFPQRNEEELPSIPKHKTSVANAPAATIHEDAMMHSLIVLPLADIEKERKSEAATARQREAAAPDRRTNTLPDLERLEVAQTCGWASAGHAKIGHMHCTFRDF